MKKQQETRGRLARLLGRIVKPKYTENVEFMARKIALNEIDDDEIESLCGKAGLEIRCIDKNAPAGMQWLFGWIYKYKGECRYTTGGITKREIYEQVTKA